MAKFKVNTKFILVWVAGAIVGLLGSLIYDVLFPNFDQQWAEWRCDIQSNTTDFYRLREQAWYHYDNGRVIQGDEIATELWLKISEVEECDKQILRFEKGKLLCLGIGVERQSIEGRRLITFETATNPVAVDFLASGFCD